MIGVTPLFDESKNSLWMLPGYMEGIRQAGGIPIILPLEATENDLKQLYDICDGFLFTGGQDINPAFYGEKVMANCGNYNMKRDILERQLFEMAYEGNRCVLGICRGIQMINVEMGGTLYQDIQSQLSGDQKIEHVMKAPYDKSQHRINIKLESPLYALFKKEEIGVNSYHHQGIKTLGNDLEIMACAPDGLVEAVCVKEKHFIWGLQWHPEYSFESDGFSRKIFEEFITVVKETVT